MSRSKVKCAVPACSCQIASAEIMCAPHWAKVSKQRKQRISLWKDRIAGNPAQDHPDFETWVQRYEYCVASAVQQAGRS